MAVLFYEFKNEEYDYLNFTVNAERTTSKKNIFDLFSIIHSHFSIICYLCAERYMQKIEKAIDTLSMNYIV